jgi:hypothetical protein
MSNTTRSETRGPGRPRLGHYRLETIVSPAVRDKLVREETASGVYRTRVAAKVLEKWATDKSQSKEK